MIILSDTDVVRKLACCELLLDFLQHLECPPNEVWVLPALRPMLRRWLANCPEAAKNADQFLKRVKHIPPARLETLERFSALDVGEQQLLAVLCDEPRVKHLVTGDKRALDKIAALTFGDVELRARLQEAPVYCFEAVMLALLEKRGFSIIQARVRNKWAKLPGQQVDGVVLQAFPANGTEELAIQVLSDRVGRLKVSLPPICFQ